MTGVVILIVLAVCALLFTVVLVHWGRRPVDRSRHAASGTWKSSQKVVLKNHPYRTAAPMPPPAPPKKQEEKKPEARKPYTAGTPTSPLSDTFVQTMIVTDLLSNDTNDHGGGHDSGSGGGGGYDGGSSYGGDSGGGFDGGGFDGGGFDGGGGGSD